MHNSKLSVAMKNLREKGYIVTDENGFMILTESGKEIANNVYERHDILSSWLMSLGVSETNAKSDACRIEHILCDENYNAIKKSF